MEQWKTIKDYPAYEISNEGRVKSNIKTSLILKGGYDKDGYHILLLYKDKKRVTRKVHRLVAEAFIPNPNNYPIINHINGIKNDNRVENLEWSTQ